MRADRAGPRRVVDVDVRDLMVGDGERRAGAGVEQLVAELVAHARSGRARAAPG